MRLRWPNLSTSSSLSSLGGVPLPRRTTRCPWMVAAAQAHTDRGHSGCGQTSMKRERLLASNTVNCYCKGCAAAAALRLLLASAAVLLVWVAGGGGGRGLPGRMTNTCRPNSCCMQGWVRLLLLTMLVVLWWPCHALLEAPALLLPRIQVLDVLVAVLALRLGVCTGVKQATGKDKDCLRHVHRSNKLCGQPSGTPLLLLPGVDPPGSPPAPCLALMSMQTSCFEHVHLLPCAVLTLHLARAGSAFRRWMARLRHANAPGVRSNVDKSFCSSARPRPHGCLQQLSCTAVQPAVRVPALDAAPDAC
jgi:hypothetical protein